VGGSKNSVPRAFGKLHNINRFWYGIIVNNWGHSTTSEMLLIPEHDQSPLWRWRFNDKHTAGNLTYLIADKRRWRAYLTNLIAVNTKLKPMFSDIVELAGGLFNL
jgi:hypothetical protein